MASTDIPDYSDVVSATGFLRPRASRSLPSFHEHLAVSSRILALIGAGLSAPSGLPTFRGAGGLWRNHDAKALATPQAFHSDPGLVWTFFLERRRAAQDASPNAAHLALAELAKQKSGFLAISMNIDGLHERAGHLSAQIKLLHGDLREVKCSRCARILVGECAEQAVEGMSTARHDQGTTLTREQVPHCPECITGLLRPNVVWFTEPVPTSTLAEIYAWIEGSAAIDTMLVLGTSAEVYPTTAYIEAARRKGARIAVNNIEAEDVALLALAEQDWYFQGDAVQIVPEMLAPVINPKASFVPQ